jgi:hypothetical protein
MPNQLVTEYMWQSEPVFCAFCSFCKLKCRILKSNVFAHFLSWVCSIWSNSQWTVLLGGPEALEGDRVKEEAWGVEKHGLNAAPQQCTCLHITPCLRIFDEAWDGCCPPTALLTTFGPCRLLSLLRLKYVLKGHRSQMIEEIEENLLRDLCASPQTVFQYAFQNWKESWKQCVDSGGEYFEGDKSY